MSYTTTADEQTAQSRGCSHHARGQTTRPCSIRWEMSHIAHPGSQAQEMLPPLAWASPAHIPRADPGCQCWVLRLGHWPAHASTLLPTQRWVLGSPTPERRGMITRCLRRLCKLGPTEAACGVEFYRASRRTVPGGLAHPHWECKVGCRGPPPADHEREPEVQTMSLSQPASMLWQ